MENQDKKIKKNEGGKYEETKKDKPVIKYNEMTSSQIIKLTEKPKEPFYNKKILCKLLEKQGYKIIK